MAAIVGLPIVDQTLFIMLKYCTKRKTAITRNSKPPTVIPRVNFQSDALNFAWIESRGTPSASKAGYLLANDRH